MLISAASSSEYTFWRLDWSCCVTLAEIKRTEEAPEVPFLSPRADQEGALQETSLSAEVPVWPVRDVMSTR